MRRVSELVVGIEDRTSRQNEDKLNRQIVIDAAALSVSRANPVPSCLFVSIQAIIWLLYMSSTAVSIWDGIERSVSFMQAASQ